MSVLHSSWKYEPDTAASCRLLPRVVARFTLSKHNLLVCEKITDVAGRCALSAQHSVRVRKLLQNAALLLVAWYFMVQAYADLDGKDYNPDIVTSIARLLYDYLQIPTSKCELAARKLCVEPNCTQVSERLVPNSAASRRSCVGCSIAGSTKTFHRGDMRSAYRMIAVRVRWCPDVAPANTHLLGRQ